MMHQFYFAVNAKEKTYFSMQQNNTVPPINNLFVEKESYFHEYGVVHHLLITVTQQVFSMTIFLEVRLGTGKGQVTYPNLQ